MEENPKPVVVFSRLLRQSAVKGIQRLSDLMDDENPETARKACVDVLKLHALKSRPHRTDKNAAAPRIVEPLDDAAADRLLRELTANDAATADGGT